MYPFLINLQFQKFIRCTLFILVFFPLFYVLFSLLIFKILQRARLNFCTQQFTSPHSRSHCTPEDCFYCIAWQLHPKLQRIKLFWEEKMFLSKLVSLTWATFLILICKRWKKSLLQLSEIKIVYWSSFINQYVRMDRDIFFIN